MFIAVLLAFSLGACQSTEGETEKPDLKSILPGTWDAVSLKVQVNSANGTDSSYVFDVPERDWLRKIGQPIKTFYQLEQNNYKRSYYDQKGNKLDEDRGKWYVFGDSLMLVTPDATYNYTVKIEGMKASFFSMIDWDGDGVEDDEYTGVHRKISNYGD